MKIIKLISKINPRVVAGLLLLVNWYHPLIATFIVAGVGEQYMSAIDVDFEYLGKEPYAESEEKNMEILYALNGAGKYDYWAYAADSEQEYIVNCGNCGMSMERCQRVDFEDYIMVMSVNRPLAAIRIMENSPVWKDGVVYSYPQYVFKPEKEEYMVYYYKVYRADTEYEKQGEKINGRLKLWQEPYFEQKSNNVPKPAIEGRGPLKRWRWAFNLFNQG